MGSRVGVLARRARIALVVVVAAGAVTVADAKTPPRRLHDEANVVPRADVPRFDTYLEHIFAESDVDIRIVFARALGEVTIEDAAVARMDRLGIGRRGGRERGTLLLYDVAQQRLRVEVGYGLEEYFPDAFVAYLMREHVRAFFAEGDVSTGLRLTLRMLHHRIRSAILQNAFDPGVLTAMQRGRGHLSGGAGASMSTPLGRDPSGFVAGPLDATVRARFRPQPTPAATYARYLEWLMLGRFDPALDMFTPESTRYMAGLRMSRAYMDYLVLGEYGRRFEVDTRGDLALLYFTDDPLVSPHLFRRTPEGWRMDIVAEVRDTRNFAGGVYVWDWRGADDDFSRAFADKLVTIRGYVRIAGGDNRPLPERAPRR